ncbi:MAG: hypothetical protein KDA91_01540 [Planctomycetaceae bacterium]|nr:hypothetical protein [Planctomycetaceae bacterium]
MGKKCSCPPQPAEVPKWFMTYSDVITLLMTFFILLLTFASSEPESFERMQVAVFGGGGATGFAGDPPNTKESDTLVVRYRPNSARMTQRGAEAAPMETDPVTESVAKGLEALAQHDELVSAERVSTNASLQLLRDSSGLLTAHAQQLLRMLAVQLRGLPMTVEFRVSEKRDVDFAVQMARYIMETQQVPHGRILVSVGGEGAVPKGNMKMVLTRTEM